MVEDNKAFSRNNQNIDVEFINNDGNKATVKLDFELIGTQHNISEKIYFISNSLVEVVESINEQTE
ncbi:hypothetical protein V1503_23680 [Bacillus sp. SCS-151]|uniref:hypothetical protein n=1 Tax=Nanhaiella sioensis TaxID=3115293 RepID=UPI00397BA194